MNKSGLIETLSSKLNLTEKKAIDVVNLIFKGFTDELKKKWTYRDQRFWQFCSKEIWCLYGQKSKNRY